MEHKTTTAVQKKHDFKLPLTVSTKVDIGRLIRELETLDNSARKNELLKQSAATDLGDISASMKNLLEINKLDLQKNQDRLVIKAFLNDLKKQAPVIYISFSSDPPAKFMEQITEWFRREINPSVLLSVGMQPKIGVGCIVRTANKQFDMSLGKDFDKKRSLLLDRISLTNEEAGLSNFIPVQAAPQEQAS